MEIEKRWIEKLEALSEEECIPLGDSPRASVYSAVFQNKEKLDGKKFRTQKDKKTKKWFVCRVK